MNFTSYEAKNDEKLQQLISTAIFNSSKITFVQNISRNVNINVLIDKFHNRHT
jgi:signal recognition particle receptor subunit beta